MCGELSLCEAQISSTHDCPTGTRKWRKAHPEKNRAIRRQRYRRSKAAELGLSGRSDQDCEARPTITEGRVGIRDRLRPRSVNSLVKQLTEGPPRRGSPCGNGVVGPD